MMIRSCDLDVVGSVLVQRLYMLCDILIVTFRYSLAKSVKHRVGAPPLPAGAKALRLEYRPRNTWFLIPKKYVWHKQKLSFYGSPICPDMCEQNHPVSAYVKFYILHFT